MKAKNILQERDREATEKRLLETMGDLINEYGFEKIGINAVAAQSGVSKILIYRYFGSIEGLMAAYIRKYDFWINFPHELSDSKNLSAFLKKMLHEQITHLRNNPILKRLYRWELSSDNEMIARLREQREKIGLNLIEQICEISGYSRSEIASLATIISTSITYLVMLEEFCPCYNGIPLRQDLGWEQITREIDKLVDLYFPISLD